MRGREDGARGSFRTIAVLTLIPVGGLALFFAWNAINDGESPRGTVMEARATARPVPRGAARPPGSSEFPGRGKAQPRPKTSEEREEPRGTRETRQIVLIIDDLGFDGQPLERVMALDPNVNCSILPNGARAAHFAKTLHARGFEVLCHLPMEPRGSAAPGRNAILTSMSEEEIATTTRENIDAVPHARGVNNHMGSRATSDRRVMESVIGALPEGLYFIDSRTTGRSVAAEVAREMNVRTATRHVFLDDDDSEAAVRRQVRALAEAAERHGTAVAIGHPYPVTLRVLAEELPGLRARGFRLVRASEAVR